MCLVNKKIKQKIIKEKNDIILEIIGMNYNDGVNHIKINFGDNYKIYKYNETTNLTEFDIKMLVIKVDENDKIISVFFKYI